MNKSLAHRNRKKWELDIKLIPELSELCQNLNLSFSCTPFYLKAVNELLPFVDFFKIASYELLWLDLFEKCGMTGKPIVFSTGMANLREVENALSCLMKTNTKSITLLHCNSAYPTPIEDSNLEGIVILKNLINKIDKKNDVKLKVGYSDHTVSEAVVLRAIHKYEASFIEFHIDLDGNGEEFASGHCWLPDEISKVISNARKGFLADGKKIFEPSKSEFPDRDWRADPLDGLRPLQHIRKNFNG